MSNGRVSEITALINCEPGGQAHIILSLDQGGVTGEGQAETACQGRLLRVPITVPARGPSGFQVGLATAHVEAIVRSEGDIVEDAHWTRPVTLTAVR